MKSIAPNIFVDDIEETIEFYEKLDFELVSRVPEEDEIVWAMMVNGNVQFMFQTFKSLGDELPQVKRSKGGSLLLYIQVNEIKKLYEKIKNKVEVIKEMEKAFYGANEFSIKDNNDYILTFAENED